MAISLWHPFSRSYGAILPSSLTMLLPSALGFSPHPPVSVYGTGFNNTIAAFLDTRAILFSTLISILPRFRFTCGFAYKHTMRLYEFFHPSLELSSCVPTFLIIKGAGIFTSCPSTTLFSLALGPDLPRADQLHPGNLRYSAERILTFLSLLIPAFSLQNSPLLLIGTASSCFQCSSTNGNPFLSFGVVF